MPPGSTDRRPERVESILNEVLARLGFSRDMAEYQLWQAWDDVVGPAVARNAQPLRFANQRLVVTVRSTGWMQELSMLRHELCARLNDRLNRNVVREIFLVLGHVEHEPANGPSARAVARKAAARTGSKENRQAPPLDGPETARRLRAAIDRLWTAAGERPQGRTR